MEIRRIMAPVRFATTLASLALPALFSGLLTLPGCHALAGLTTPDLVMMAPSTEHIEIWRSGADAPLVVQETPADARPYLHPLGAPDGRGVFTEVSPSHHVHQTGVYFGLPEVNGKSYFHHKDDGLFKLREVHAGVVESHRATWSLVYEWLGDAGPVLFETQKWTLLDHGSWYTLDLDWSAEAKVDVTVQRYDYGGLFVRMPWRPETGGRAVNSEGHENSAAEGERAQWVDLGIPIPVRAAGDWGHIAILEHPANPGAPTPFRVDDQLGFGPCRARLGDWSVAAGRTTRTRHRLLVYTGPHDRNLVESVWLDFSAGK